MKIKWSKETPTEEGWYWFKYKGGNRKTVTCPCEVCHFTDGYEATVVISARNDTFYEGPHHGGKGLKYKGKLDKSVRFGPKIPFPD